MDRYSQPNIAQRGRPVSAMDSAYASDYFDPFLNATSLKQILGYYRTICDYLHLKPNVFPHFYPKLRANLTTWKAKALFKKIDARASHKCYGKGKLCANKKVLIIGAGPCGLRTAIEAQLLGAKVVVIEKRDRITRNNVLHLWPFVIEDLRALGAKKFFGKFCAGAIDHISIRQLQCILLKVALILGVEVHTEVSFERLIEPTEKTGWRAELKPSDHPVSQYEFDVIIGADGKRNTLQGFKRKEFRGKLAIAITANFINKKTEAEARVEEISGVAFIFNQKFFKDLYEETKIDLENIVYYKDDTHYFVMTAKKASLLEKGVIKQDLTDTEKLLAPDNVDKDALQDYAREAANFSTNYQMPDVEFAVNHYGQPDVNMFDFTSMYAAENASKIVERHGYPLLMILVGDSLLEPFWPTGSGCARGFLSSLDAAWAIRTWVSKSPLEVIAERESIYRLLAQTTPDNLNKDCKSYTLDPATRYPNLNTNVVMPLQVTYLYDTDNSSSIEQIKRNAYESEQIELPKKRRRAHVDNEMLLDWVSNQVKEHDDIFITDIGAIFKDGKVLCAIINHYRPDLLDFNAMIDEDPVIKNQLAIDILEKELGIPPIMTGEEITTTEDYLALTSYLTQVYHTFKGEIPHIKHPKLELPESARRTEASKTTKVDGQAILASQQQQNRPLSRHKRHADMMTPSKVSGVDRKTRKRRTLEKVGASVVERQRVLEEIAANRNDRQNKRRQQRKLQTEQFMKSMQMLQANAKPDHSQPFEDYSIFLYRQTAPNFEERVKDLEKKFTYVPDHENKLPSQSRGGNDEDLQARIKSFENKCKDPQPVEKKPKDLLRAIGKIDNSDWNIKEIEKKIMENKLGKAVNKDKEKVPKWSKEQFLARQTKMESKHLDRQDSAEAKYADIDKNIKNLDLKLKEGTIRELGQNKVASITEKFVNKTPTPQEPKPVEKNTPRPAINLPTQGGSEFCHFCGKRVYLMERLSAEGRFFHHGCFKCQYCHTQLRLGSYSFDRDGQFGYKFFCIHHFGMQGELPRPVRVVRKPSQRYSRDVGKSPEKKRQDTVPGLDLLDRVQTPERIDYANLSTEHASDHEESLSQMDEDEWTDRNFGASCNELEDSDEEDSSSYSDTSSDDEDAYDDALDEPITKEGTMKWAERLHKRYSKKRNDSDSNGYSSSDHFSYENSSEDDDSDTATEGEEEIRARELRKQEVQVQPPVVQTDTGTDTEVVSDETSSKSSSEIQNSATEISTDSEFAQDDPTPTREIPAITFNDCNVTKTRGSSGIVKKIQVTSRYLQKPVNGKKSCKPDNELILKPLVSPAPINKKPAPVLLPRTEGYALNRTQSTGGIAAKKSLELKKKYLLGETTVPGSIQKSGSASTLDTKFKSFHTNISEQQKLLKTTSDIGTGLQLFSSKNENTSPILSPSFPQIFPKDTKTSPDKNQKESAKELPPPDVTQNNTQKPDTFVFQNELEGRPRSPVHETSIIVPEIDWSKKNQSQSEDSLSITSSSGNEFPNKPNFSNIPRVEVHMPIDDDAKDIIPLDSLCVSNEQPKVEYSTDYHSSLCSESTKSITSKKKSLNEPKSLPALEKILPEIYNSLHNKHLKENKESATGNHDDDDKTCPEQIVAEMELSDAKDEAISDDCAEQATVALTETELSDWARDGTVSDDMDELAEFELNEQPENIRSNKKPKDISAESIKKADMSEFDDFGHVCGKVDFLDHKKLADVIETKSSVLTSNLDNIEYMDTETSSDEGIVDSQNGYSLLKSDDDLAEDSLNPTINNVIEAKNECKIDAYKNTGYCIISKDDNNFGAEVIDLKPSDLEKMKQKHITDHDEDSLLIIETGTTTEENTCSDSTVKNITEINADKEKSVVENNNFQKQRLEEKLASVKAEQAMLKQLSVQKKQSSHEENNVDVINLDFDEHCQRLQSKVEFGNVKDSIDIRKSRRKSKSDSPQKPDLIQEEKDKSTVQNTAVDLTLNLSPIIRTPDILYKKENIMKERDVNQKLVQEMVMNKMKAENKSLERKKRNRTPSNKPYDLTKSATTAIVSQINLNNLDKSNRISTYSSNSSIYATPDVLLPTKSIPLQLSQSVNAVPDLNSSSKYSTPLTPTNDNRPLSVHSTFAERKLAEIKRKLPENNIHLSDTNDVFETPKAPPRLKHEEINKTAEKMKEDARARVRLLSNEELGLSPEDRLLKLREKHGKRGKENTNVDSHVQESIESLVINTERRNSWFYSNDTLKKKKNNSFRRSKSGGDCTANDTTHKMTYKNSNDDINLTKSNSEINKNFQIYKKSEESDTRKICKSDPNLLDTDHGKPKKKNESKSFTKKITTFFSKKHLNGSKGFLSMISPKKMEKDKSKSCTNLKVSDSELVVEEPSRSKSFSEVHTERKYDSTPPPVPPLPLNYTGNSVKGTDESSDGEHDWKLHDRSSCDTLDQSGVLETSMSGIPTRRRSKTAKRARQTQLKRHRMAQEIQRKLEETEVKTRELEKRGVMVEKALRGEDGENCAKEESELLQEWFDLMRDRTELRRYEKELLIRAQELELEDRHARLQHELRDRLGTDETKTEDDVKVEESIIREMMDIVAKRDSLIAVLEEDRLRYTNEDRDLEEQMLAKGLILTSIRKTPEK